VLTPIDFSRYESALATPLGWVELAIVAGCFTFGWLLDRRVRLKSASDVGMVHVGLGGMNRLLLPLTTLVLLAIAAVAFRHWRPPFFIAIAVPLMLALALIRLLVYALRGLFGTHAWLRASERVISFAIWGLVLLYFSGVLPELRDELDGIEIPVGSKHVSVFEILKGTVVVVLVIAGTLWVSSLFEQRLARAENLDNNVRVVLGKFIRALLLALGVLFALDAVGIDLTLLTVFGGALGVGIGLGLQKLASNYIAGFTILLDRSIRLGDMITVDGRYGIVTRVTSRYVVLRSLDGIEAIVPNETLVTTTVLNHTYTSKNVRMAISIQISYDSDVDRALQLMAEAALAEPRVLRAPNAPGCFVARFAESGIEVELGVWIADPENGQLDLRSSLNRAILRSFNAEGIKIPFPQRELRILRRAGSNAPPPPEIPGRTGSPA
jgi:small-conductance mechanosensitive channel